MKKIVLLNKKIGQTPLEAIEEFRGQDSKFRKVKLAYAGRLDPMAEGLLLVLAGCECKKREKYQSLSKEYDIEVLFGVETDSYDVLGIVKNLTRDNKQVINEEEINKYLEKYKKIWMQKYPPFSSKTVLGKPLYWWARKGKINEIKIPKKKVEIYKISLLSLKNVRSEKIKKMIGKKISLVKGDFRQKVVIKSWSKFFGKKSQLSDMTVMKIRVVCLSGTYMRSLAKRFGDELKVGAIALSIKRTKIGSYKLPKK